MFLIKFLGGLLLFALLFGIIIAFAVFARVWRVVKSGKPGNAASGGSERMSATKTKEEPEQKIFDASEGEYVDFEEIKDDCKQDR